MALLWWGGALLLWQVGLYCGGRWDFTVVGGRGFTVVGVGLYYDGKGLQDFLLGVLCWSSDRTLSVLTT